MTDAGDPAEAGDAADTNDPADTNDAVWKSERGVAAWLSESETRERRRSEQRRLMAELLPVGEDEAFTFVDLGAGTAPQRAILERYPNANAVLADFSSQMREEGTRALAEHAGRFVYAELDLNAGGPWPPEIPASVKAVITSLCVHHLPDARKAALLREIHDRLEPGGWYLNLDAVSTDDPVVGAAWQRADARLDPEEAARRDHPTPEQAMRHENHVRFMIPLERQLEMLRDAGFEGVDVYWKQLDFVIDGGRRPE